MAYGEKPQAGDGIDVASLQYDPAKSLNNEIIYDRTRLPDALERAAGGLVFPPDRARPMPSWA